MPCGFLNLLSHIVVHFHVEYICDQVQSILVILDFRIEASEVEAISQVILVDFAKVLVAA